MTSVRNIIIIVVSVCIAVLIAVAVFIYQRRRRRSNVTHSIQELSVNYTLTKDPLSEPLSEPLPEKYRGINLYRDTKIVYPKNRHTVPFTNNVPFTISDLTLSYMITLARFISSGYRYSFTQVYEEDGQLYIYEAGTGYCMLILKDSSVTEYKWPKKAIYNSEIRSSGYNDMYTQIYLASEKTDMIHPNYQFKVNGTNYVCNTAYPKAELENYLGLCDTKTPLEYYSDTQSRIMDSQGNSDFMEYTKEPLLFYKVTKINGLHMDIEPIQDIDILSMVKSGKYDVFGIYKECDRLFIFDKNAKKHMPIIWFVNQLSNSVVNRLTLHQPYFRSHDTELRKFEKPVDILCMPKDHWVEHPGFKPDERFATSTDVGVNENDRLYVGSRSKFLLYGYRYAKAEQFL